MKNLNQVFGLIIILSIFSVFAFSQEKTKLASLPENASLEEIQKWLAKGLKHFSEYSSEKSSENQYDNAHKNEHNRISEVKFDGCKLTYIVTNITTIDSHYLHSTIGSSESSSPVGTSPGSSIKTETSTLIFLDLAEMNPRSINYTNLTPNGMKTLIISTSTGEKDVVYKKFYKKLNEKEVLQNRAIFIVKDEAAEQIKNGLIQAMKICQPVK